MTTKRVSFALMMIALLAIGTASVKVKATNDKSLTGAWITTVEAEGFPPFKAMLNCNDDGTLLFSQAALVATPGGTLVYSNGHGVWEKQRSGQFAFKFAGLIHDQSGAPAGSFEVHGSIHVVGMMNNFSADASACDFDPAGNPTFCFDATFEGERIRIGS